MHHIDRGIHIDLHPRLMSALLEQADLEDAVRSRRDGENRVAKPAPRERIGTEGKLREIGGAVVIGIVQWAAL